MTAAMLCGHCGIESKTIENSAAYIATWLGRIKGDPKLVVTAASKAQQAADMVLGVSFASQEPDATSDNAVAPATSDSVVAQVTA